MNSCYSLWSELDWIVLYYLQALIGGAIFMQLCYRKASKLFNSRSLASLVKGDLELVSEVANNYLGTNDFKELSKLYDQVLESLSKNYKNEYVFKNILAERYLLGRHNLNTATMLSEFRVGINKADSVIINGHSTCYEIKTNYDSLNRIDEQIKSYQKVFDKTYVVTTAKHYHSLLDRLDTSVGILLLSERNYLLEKRKAHFRTEPVDIALILKSLRKAEYTELARNLSGEVPNVPNGNLYDACKEVILGCRDNDLVRKNLWEIVKTNRSLDKHLIESLPRSLLNAAISYDLKKSQAEKLKRIFA